jgi:hypothetical protein
MHKGQQEAFARTGYKGSFALGFHPWPFYTRQLCLICTFAFLLLIEVCQLRLSKGPVASKQMLTTNQNTNLKLTTYALV